METSVKHTAPNFKALFAFAIALFLLPVAAYSAGATTQRPLDDLLFHPGELLYRRRGGWMLIVCST